MIPSTPSRRFGRWLWLTSRTRRSLAAGLVIAGVAVVPPVLTSAGATACQYAGSLGRGWAKLAIPPFTVGLTSSNAARYGAYPYYQGGGALFAVLPGSGQVLLATNGSQIMRSTNRGCTWSAVYTYQGGNLGQSPPSLAGTPAEQYTNNFTGSYEIQAFGVPRYPAQHLVVYAVVSVAGCCALAPALVNDESLTLPVTILRSGDGGASWAPVSAGPTASATDVPRCHTNTPWNGPLQVAVAPSHADTLYLACATTGYTGDNAVKLATSSQSDIDLYESTDGGVSWTHRSTPTSFAYGISLQGVAIDPGHADRVWLATNESTTSKGSSNIPTAWYSADSGQHWSAKAVGGHAFARGDPNYSQSVGSCCGEFGVDVAPSGAVTVARGSDGVLASTDVGRHWRTYARGGGPAGTVIAHSVFAPNGDLYALRDLGVPPKYQGPTFCANDDTSWEQLVRIRRGRASAVATPRGFIGDFYGLQSAGNGRTTTLLGFALLRATPANCGSYQRTELVWTGTS